MWADWSSLSWLQAGTGWTTAHTLTHQHMAWHPLWIPSDYCPWGSGRTI